MNKFAILKEKLAEARKDHGCYIGDTDVALHPRDKEAYLKYTELYDYDFQLLLKIVEELNLRFKVESLCSTEFLVVVYEVST